LERAEPVPSLYLFLVDLARKSGLPESFFDKGKLQQV
jgi:hypothetical protein